MIGEKLSSSSSLVHSQSSIEVRQILRTNFIKLLLSDYTAYGKRWDRRVFVETRTCKCKGESNGHTLYNELVFGNVFERRESKYFVVLMIYRLKVKRWTNDHSPNGSATKIQKY